LRLNFGNDALLEHANTQRHIESREQIYTVDENVITTTV